MRAEQSARAGDAVQLEGWRHRFQLVGGNPARDGRDRLDWQQGTEL